jgi:hypothetical protein
MDLATSIFPLNVYHKMKGGGVPFHPLPPLCTPGQVELNFTEVPVSRRLATFQIDVAEVLQPP